jgi:predicted MFS family arabinose efflux permease
MRQLYVVVALTGILAVFFDVAYQSYLPSLVKREQVLEGNSKLALGSSMAEIAGPGLAGMLVQLITAPIAILVDALSFLWSALMVWLIRKPEPIPAPRGDSRILHELAAGLRTVAGHPVQRAIARQAATASFFIGFFLSLYVLYAIRYLRISPAVLGVVIAVGGVANMLGALLAWRLARRFGVGNTLIGSMLLIGVAALMIPLSHGSVLIGTVLLVAAQLGDLGWPIYNINELTLRQAITPKDMLGRVNAVMQMLIRGVFPVGSFCGGALASVIGVRPTLTLWRARLPEFQPVARLLAYPQIARVPNRGRGELRHRCRRGAKRASILHVQQTPADSKADPVQLLCRRLKHATVDAYRRRLLRSWSQQALDEPQCDVGEES